MLMGPGPRATVKGMDREAERGQAQKPMEAGPERLMEARHRKTKGPRRKVCPLAYR